MKIKFTNYDDGIHFIELTKDAGKVGLDERFFGNVLANCKMDKTHNQITLNCELTVNAKFECDRCLTSFNSAINTSFQLIYLFEDKNDLEDDNVYSLSPNDDKIDITADVIDYTMLATPMKLLCSEECKGLCPKCGNNLNESECNCEIDEINPIWEPLLKLKDKL